MKFVLLLVILSSLFASSAHADNLTQIQQNLPSLSAEIPYGQKIQEALDKDAQCTRCHDETETKPILSLYQTPHGNRADLRTPYCQSCHGSSEQHVNGPAVDGLRPKPDLVFGNKKSLSGSHKPDEANAQNAACLSCHDKDPSRTYWQSGAHQVAEVACTSCHETHAPRDKVLDNITQPDICFTCHQEQRSQTRKFSHHPITEGKVACAECHNPHGSAGPKLQKKNTTNETCFTCHAEKRGPFLWEHQPVTEDCAICHNPHGSNITPLLNSRPPFLCQECHDGPHSSDSPMAGNTAGIQGGLTSRPSESRTGRACMNCHSLVHGSNHPAGALLQR